MYDTTRYFNVKGELKMFINTAILAKLIIINLLWKIKKTDRDPEDKNQNKHLIGPGCIVNLSEIESYICRPVK